MISQITQDTIDLIIASFSLLLFMFLIFLFFYKGNIFHTRENPYFSMSLFSLIAAELHVIFYVILNITIAEYGALLALSTSFYFLYRHYDSLETRQPSKNKHGLVMGPYITNVFYILLSLYGFLEIESIVYLYIFMSILGEIAILFSLNVVFRAWKISKDKFTLLEFLALILIWAGVTIYLIIDLIYFKPWSERGPLGFVGDILNILGLTIIFFNLRKNHYSSRIPFPIHAIIIYSQEGILLYKREFFSKVIGEKETEFTLATGMFMAISDFIKEVLGMSSELQEIQIQSKKILFTKILSCGCTLAVFSSKNSVYLKQSIDFFVRSVSQEILHTLTDLSLSISTESQLDNLLRQAFPYLKIIQNSNA